MSFIVNIAAYKFVELTNLPALRAELRDLCKTQCLCGTILLSPEGINVFVAGRREGVNELLSRLRKIPSAADLDVKESVSAEQPFNRMVVKIKREIIAFGVPGIDPRRYSSRRISAQELKRWLDEGRPLTLLDTRNEFEVRTGTFANAVQAGIEDFRDFPAAVGRLPEELKGKPIVTFCTGGIRCEKAAPFLERAGFEEVYQLDGGILKYFEECGGEHYQGHCFVFDKRVALDTTLNECGLQQCFVCQAVLSPEDQTSALYVVGVSCPRCYLSDEQATAKLIERRHAAIRKAMSPLPGSEPYDNVRPISVPLRLDGVEVLDFLDAMHTHLSRDAWREACLAGQVICRGQAVRPGKIVRAGERLLHTMPATREPDVATAIEILHEDEAIVVINKPAPLPMHPCGRFNRNSLSYVLDLVYHPLKLRPAHRLDADTSGVVVFSKTRDVARVLQPQFEAGGVSIDDGGGSSVPRASRLCLDPKGITGGTPVLSNSGCGSDSLASAAAEAATPVNAEPSRDTEMGNARVSKTYLARVHGHSTESKFECHFPINVGPGPGGVRLPDADGVPASTRFRRLRNFEDGTSLLEVQPLTGRTNQIRAHLWKMGFPIVGDPIYLQNQRLGTAQSLATTDSPLCLHATAIEFTHPRDHKRVRYQVGAPPWASAGYLG